jgi:AAA15 family ATPase/GTPase
MITNIYLENFKAFSQAEIMPAQLNILTGLNLLKFFNQLSIS